MDLISLGNFVWDNLGKDFFDKAKNRLTDDALNKLKNLLFKSEASAKDKSLIETKIKDLEGNNKDLNKDDFINYISNNSGANNINIGKNIINNINHIENLTLN